MAGADRQKPRIQSAARAIDVLLAVARRPSSGITGKELSETLGLPRQVVYHLAHTLVSVGMLRKVGGTSYGLGLAVGTLAQGFRRQLGASDFLSPYAEQAAALTGETSYVSGWLDGEIVVLATARGSATVQAAEVLHGTAGDAHARASGKLLLAMVSDAEIEAYLGRRQMAARTHHTIVTKDAFMREMAMIRSSWVAIDRQEYSLGLCCLAIPIGPAPSQTVLGLSAPVERFTLKIESYIAQLREIANQLAVNQP